MKKLFNALLLSLISFTAFASERADIGWEWINDGALVVDVRTEQEFDAGHLEDALNYPLQNVAYHFAEIDKDQPIVVYCRSGNRSGQAYNYLVSQGFTQVHNGGGLNEMLDAKQ
uniref:rhodanese-like domain-containing protein n=1 Tax=Thaumasiovibrio occultus TaxID=1891184 RepID=UPI000B354FDC|nr:rhodanese-like domain-containing protein [Thaumasiovibrio occultus]